ncbi:hypothetical protein EYF80_057055 [Liparis tanakae]|uniref:Uncharacterized protein n=1 Tax=Liparis tanakae TaxID=230148 RepID=A0A4Z2EX08_9TELE|nr:hypothetical protein EYF80_057055 [Liparis tanakae]
MKRRRAQGVQGRAESLRTDYVLEAELQEVELLEAELLEAELLEVELQEAELLEAELRLLLICIRNKNSCCSRSAVSDSRGR